APRQQRVGHWGRMGRERRYLMRSIVVALGILVVELVWVGQSTQAAEGCSTDATAKYFSVDTDGNGTVNIADAVALLAWLFQGGPDPKSCLEQQVTPDIKDLEKRITELEDALNACLSGKGLPDTGQTTCYNTAGAEVKPCPGAEARAFPGEDGFFNTGCPMQGRFLENHDGTITDICTGLMWQKMTALPPAGSVHDPNGDGFLTWEEALAYCASLGDVPETDARFDGAGFKDWRLPNVRELQSLIDYGDKVPHISGLYNDQPRTAPIAWDQIADGFHVRQYP